MRSAALVLVSLALATRATADEPSTEVATPRAAARDGRLAVRLSLVPNAEAGGREPVALDAAAHAPGAPRPCPVEWCQPPVEVPGLDVARARISRPELVARVLDDADLAPIAQLVWILARTGLELDWRPAQLEASAGTAASGRGSLMVWLKLRMDAWGRPSFPARAQRPARLSST